MSIQTSELADVASNLLAGPGLTRKERCQAWVSASVAIGDETKSLYFVTLALASGLSVSLVKEIILQSYLFCGFPAAIDGLIVLRQCVVKGGYSMEEYSDSRSISEIRSDGETLCRSVYDRNYDKLIANMESLSPSLAKWMIEEGYGKVLSRRPLQVQDRELCVVAALAVMDRERQLVSHLKGAMHVGVPKSRLQAVLESNSILVSSEIVEKNLRCLQKVTS